MKLFKILDERADLIYSMKFCLDRDEFIFVMPSSIRYELKFNIYDGQNFNYKYSIENVRKYLGNFGMSIVFIEKIDRDSNYRKLLFFEDSTVIKEIELKCFFVLSIVDNNLLCEDIINENNIYYLFDIEQNKKIWEFASINRQYFKIEGTDQICFIDDYFNLKSIDLYIGNEVWTTNVESYLIPPPKYTNGEDQCQNKVEKVLYCKKNEVIVVFLMPFKLLGIDAINGQVLWELDYQLNSNQLFIDEETGFLYIAESYFTGVQKANVIRFNVIDTKDGKKVFEKDLDYFEVYNGKQGISSILYFAGLCNSYFYITFLSGEIFKLRKETAEIVERYKHDKPFYGPPQIVGNRLFVSEDTNSKKHLQRLLIFEL